MSKRAESRSRPRQRATADLDCILQLRVSKAAKAMLEDKAKDKAVPPAILHRQVLYRYLGLIANDEEN